jgi:hypothetical protein
MTGPLLLCLHLIPHGVLAGLFFVMGIQALEANGITAKLIFLGRDAALTPPNHPLLKVKRRKAIWWFVGIEIFGFAATFAITQTIAAVGFPVFIMALIPVRIMLLPKIFTPEELDALDEPTASPFTMESCGGIHGQNAYEPDADSGEETEVSRQVPSEPDRPPLTRLKSADHHTRHDDGIFPYPGSPRKSQESIPELGKIRSGGEEGTPSRRRNTMSLSRGENPRRSLGRNPTSDSDHHDFAEYSTRSNH